MGDVFVCFAPVWLFAWVLAVWTAATRQYQSPGASSPQCGKCGYSLAGLPTMTRCPECDSSDRALPKTERRIDWSRVWLMFVSIHSLAVLWLLPPLLWYPLMRRQGFGHEISARLSGGWWYNEDPIGSLIEATAMTWAVSPLIVVLASRFSKRVSYEVAGRYLRRLPIGGTILAVIFVLMSWRGDAQSWSAIEVTFAMMGAPVATYLLLYCR